MEPVLVLFDIDGTLVGIDGASDRALSRALSELTGISDGFRKISFAGKTDLQIVREGLKSKDLPHDGELPYSLIDLYLEYLGDELSISNAHIKVGVLELLHALEHIGNIHLGLLTGNFKRGAEIKLSQFDLLQFFRVGAFGSDSEDRLQLLPIAVERLREAEDVSVPYENCVVIGDTPRDVMCARIHGAASIAVATGPYSLEDLDETEANLVVPDLSDTTQILRWIHNWRRC